MCSKIFLSCPRQLILVNSSQFNNYSLGIVEERKVSFLSCVLGLFVSRGGKEAFIPRILLSSSAVTGAERKRLNAFVILSSPFLSFLPGQWRSVSASAFSSLFLCCFSPVVSLAPYSYADRRPRGKKGNRKQKRSTELSHTKNVQMIKTKRECVRLRKGIQLRRTFTGVVASS